MAQLEVKDLSMYYKTYEGDVRAVDSVSFTLERGEALGIAGESGCGKSSMALTLLRILPANGQIVGGQIFFEPREEEPELGGGRVELISLDEERFRRHIRWRRISMVFQGAMNALNPVIRVGDQISEALQLHLGMSRPQALSRVKELFELVGLEPSRIDQYPHEFSGGMKQRAVIAMALSCNPDIIIADEPTTALDVIVQAQVLKALEGLRKEFQISLILITHDLSLIAQLCDRIAIMYAGKFAEYGEVIPVFDRPIHPYTQGLVRSFPNIAAEERQPIISIPGFPPDLIAPPKGCRFHPRCPMADEICRQEEPKLSLVGDRLVSCHFAEQIRKEEISAWELERTIS